jgi:Carboxypeptidase regulatory-like domain
MKALLLAFVLVFPPGPLAQAPASIEGFIVQLGTSTPVAGARVSIGGVSTTTDENGKFVFPDVQPGRYRIVANHNAYMPAEYGERGRGTMGADVTIGPGQAVRDVVIVLVPKGAVAGRVYDTSDKPVANANVQALKHAYLDGRRILVPVGTARSNDVGEYRLPSLPPGPYLIRAVIQPERHLPVYYPGSIDAAAASPIDVPPGIEFTGVDLRLVDSRAVRVSGSVMNGMTGQPAVGAALMLLPRRGTIATGSSLRAAASSAGSFEFRDMAPGSYELVASAPNSSEGRLAASASVEIGIADVDNITLVLQPQLSINGRVTIDGFDSANFNLQGIRVELRREPYTPELLIVLPPVGADGAFTFADVTPGDYRLKVNAPGLKGYVKSARFGAINALDPPFHIGGPGQFDIIIGLNGGSLEGTILEDSQKPFPGATAVLVPDPPRRHRFDLYYPTNSDTSGRLHLDGVAPGDYRLFAWQDVPADAWQDPDFLRLYEDRGRAVHIGEGGREKVELRLIPR